MRVSWCWFWEARPLLFFMGAKRCLSQFETRDLVEYPFGFFDLCDIPQKSSPEASTPFKATAAPIALILPHMRRKAIVTIPSYPQYRRLTSHRCNCISPNLRQVAVRACSWNFDCCCFNTKILGSNPSERKT